jgi:hypothetical protein
VPVAGLGLQGPEQLLTAAAAAAGEGVGGDWHAAQPTLLHLAVASQSPRMVSGIDCYSVCLLSFVPVFSGAVWMVVQSYTMQHSCDTQLEPAHLVYWLICWLRSLRRVHAQALFALFSAC